MRIIYAGSPAIAVPALESLVDLVLEDPAPPAGDRRGAETQAVTRAGDRPGPAFELVGALTNPDSPRGRRGKPEPTEVAAALLALEGRFERAGGRPPPVFKPEKLGAAVRAEIGALKPDLLISFAYGRIFGPKFLALFPLGGINVHPSLLPAYRGPSPIPQAILNGDRETGISVQRLVPEMDCGDILAREVFPLTGRETAATLAADMARRAARLLPGVVRDIAAGLARGRPQDPEKASYCGLLSREDGRVNWNLSARRIEARVRAYTPWPLSWTTDGDRADGGRRLYIIRADCADGAGRTGKADRADAAPAPGTVLGVDKERGILVQTGDGVLVLTALQYEGKKVLAWRDFLNGARNFTGRRLV